MSFYRRYQKRLQKGKKELTEGERRKLELRNNIILVVVLVIGFGVALLATNQFRTEVKTYDAGLYIVKNVSDMPDLDSIEPLYKYEEKTIDFSVIEISDEEIYTKITDEIYADYEKHYNFYKDFIWKEYNLENIEYFRFDVETGKLMTYYYLADNKLYKSKTLTDDLNSKNLILLENINISKIYELIKIDMPKTFGDYVEYIVDLNYYSILTEKQNSISGNVILTNGDSFKLSLINFIDLINLLEASKESDELAIEVEGF